MSAKPLTGFDSREQQDTYVIDRYLPTFDISEEPGMLDFLAVLGRIRAHCAARVQNLNASKADVFQKILTSPQTVERWPAQAWFENICSKVEVYKQRMREERFY